MESWSYKNILNKIKKIEKSMKRLEMSGFGIDKNELRDIIVANKIYGNDALNYLKIHTELNDLLNHLNRLEKIDEYYNWVKFRINSDKNVRLFLDTYVNDTLEVLKPLNAEIKEYGFTNFKKFAPKFYNLVYFLMKLEIGINGESEIGREMFSYSRHTYCLQELMVSEINRIGMSSNDRQALKSKLSEKKYDSFVEVMIKLIKEDKKIRKLLNLNDDDIEKISNKIVQSDQEALQEIKKMVKKKK